MKINVDEAKARSSEMAVKEERLEPIDFDWLKAAISSLPKTRANDIATLRAKERY